MSRLREIVVEGESSAPPDAVWNLLSDTRSYTRWAGASRATVESGHGVGEQRWVHASGLTTHERVIVFDPPRHYEYKLLGGAPIRDYTSEVTLDATPTGTHIRWTRTSGRKCRSRAGRSGAGCVGWSRGRSMGWRGPPRRTRQRSGSTDLSVAAALW